MAQENNDLCKSKSGFNSLISYIHERDTFAARLRVLEKKQLLCGIENYLNSLYNLINQFAAAPKDIFEKSFVVDEEIIKRFKRTLIY